MRRVTMAAIDHTTTGRRPRRRGASVLVVVALVAATLAAVVTAPTAPVAADGNEAPAAPLAARSITAGSNHTCAIVPSGAVKCWGLNTSGQLGQDSTANLGDAPEEMAALAPVNLGAGRTATAVTAGGDHTCARLDDATVKCWGAGASGQLGQDSTANLGDGPGEMAALAPVNLGTGRTATAVTAGNVHTCALLDDATVKCWGAGVNGRLGQDSGATLGDAAGEMAALAPVNLGAGRTATAVTAGALHTCALLDDATVRCWGNGVNGRLGQDSTAHLGDEPGEMAALVPVNLGAGRTATAITAGSTHTCALLDDATVKCWGAGSFGQLGQDSTTNLGDAAGEMAALPAVNLGAGRTATAITAGVLHTCARLDDATVKCWGGGGSGQLGQGSTANLGDAAGEMAALASLNLGAGHTSTAVTAGASHTCARLDDATVKCWGAGANGQLGQGSTATLGDQAGEMAALQPVDLGVPLQAALTADEPYLAPGEVIHYHLRIINNGAAPLTGVTVADPNAPACAQAVPDIAAGQVVTIDCSYTTNGADYPNRANTATVDTDQTSPKASNTVNVPVGVPLTTATAITAGYAHTCALLDNGTVRCWGAGNAGQLGQDSTANLGDGPFEMAALAAVNLGAGRTATAVTAGEGHTCALLDDGTVRCWGAGGAGQLGQDSTATLGDQAGEMAALAPVNLGAGRTATAITASNYHTCALLDDATVKCWGGGGSGQLGQGSTANLGDQAGEMAALAPVNLGAGRTATAVTAGTDHTCARLDDATVKCWGFGASGQLGQGSTATLGDAAGEMAALAPVNLGAGRTATAITAGEGSNHTCALLDDATVKCWGNGANGQFGQGPTATLGDAAGEMAALAPVNLGAGRTATAITAGASHTCARLDDATVKCWGLGNGGQLGQDSTATLGDAAGEMAALAPVNLGAGRTATAITASLAHTCALLDNATVKCWGNGAFGRLGQDSTATLGDAAGEMAALAPILLGLEPPPAPGLSVTKSADETTVAAGDTVHLHVTVTNTGNVALNDVTVVDANAPDCDETITSIAVGADHTVDCTYVTGPGDVGTYSNTASVTSDEVTTPVVSNQIDVTVDAAAPSLTVTKSADETAVVAGDTIHLHVAVANTGNVALNDVTIDDPNGPDCEAAPFDLAVGADRTVDCTYVTGPGDVGTYSNTASVTSTEVTTPVESNTVDVTVTAAPAPGLSVVKSADEVSVSPSQTIHYHLVVTNTGNVALTGVDAVDANAPDCGDDPTFDLAVGAFATIDCAYVAGGNDVGTYSNTASVTSAEVTSPVVSNQVDVTVDPAVTVVKTADQTGVVAGEDIDYHVTVTNASAVTLTGLAVTDANAPGCDGVLADLAPGADVTVDCTYTTTAGDVGTYSNTATVDSAGIVAVDSNRVDVTVDAQAPSLSVDKTADETAVVVGDTVHLHVKVTNTGNAALTNVTIVDANAASCEVAPFSLAVGADRTVDCTHKAIAAEVAGGYHNTASVTADEVTTPVVSNTVDVAVTIPPTAGLVSGTVTETGSGTPVAGAVVMVLSTATFAPVAVATANASGAYVAAPAAGTYFVYVLDPTQGHAAGFSGAPTPVAVTAGNTATADAALASIRGTISGTVTDTGGPLAGVLAMSVNLATGQPGAGDLTDNTGVYSIPGLAPGPRLLEFIDLSATHTVEYYDDSPTPAGSSILTIAGAGATTADAALATQAGPGTGAHLTGQVTSTTGGNLEGVAVLALRTSDFGLAAADLTDGTGSYDIALDPGTYKLAFYDPSGTHLFEWHDNQPASGLGSAATVTATAGTPLATNAALTPTTGVVSGTVTDTGSGTNLANVFVIAINTSGVVVGATTTAANGTYTLANLPVGSVRIRFVDLGGAHTDEYYDDSPDYAGGALVAITAGSATPNTNAALTPTP